MGLVVAPGHLGHLSKRCTHGQGDGVIGGCNRDQHQEQCGQYSAYALASEQGRPGNVHANDQRAGSVLVDEGSANFKYVAIAVRGRESALHGNGDRAAEGQICFAAQPGISHREQCCAIGVVCHKVGDTYLGLLDQGLCEQTALGLTALGQRVHSEKAPYLNGRLLHKHRGAALFLSVIDKACERAPDEHCGNQDGYVTRVFHGVCVSASGAAATTARFRPLALAVYMAWSAR